MKIEGKIPHSGPLADRIAASQAKSAPSGKSFAEVLQRAKDVAPSVPAPKLSPTPETASPSTHTPDPEDYLATIKFRMQSGFYESKSISDALSEKLTGFFDELS